MQNRLYESEAGWVNFGFTSSCPGSTCLGLHNPMTWLGGRWALMWPHSVGVGAGVGCACGWNAILTKPLAKVFLNCDSTSLRKLIAYDLLFTRMRSSTPIAVAAGAAQQRRARRLLEGV